MAKISENRPVVDFSEVVLQTHGDIQLIQGEQESLIIEADEEIVAKIKSEVRAGKLVLRPVSWLDWVTPNAGPIRYRITMKTIRGLAMSGSGALNAARVRTDQLKLDVSGAGEMEIEQLDAQALEVSVSGAGRVEIRGGQAQRLEVQISGTGSLRAPRMDCMEADLRISGSGQVTVNVHQALHVSITGFGSVRYLGAAKVSHQITGAGSIEHI